MKATYTFTYSFTQLHFPGFTKTKPTVLDKILFDEKNI